MESQINNGNTKPFVFVLMPFHSDFDDIYQVGIKAACLSAGAHCERVDEQIFVENILERVYSQIAKADIIISEMTGRNPNVFYETGYAHALDKRVILLTQNADDIPFDLKHYPHIIYSGKIAHLKTELEKRIKWYINNLESGISRNSSGFVANPVGPRAKVDFDFDFLINGKKWKNGLDIEIPCEVRRRDRFEPPRKTTEIKDTDDLSFSLHIGLHNASNMVVESAKYHLGLIIPSIFKIDSGSETDSVTFNGRDTIARLTGFRTIFPDDWNSARIILFVNVQNLPNDSTEFTLKLFSEFGAKDYKFKVHLVLQKSG